MRTEALRRDWLAYLIGSAGVAFLALFLIYPVGKVALLAFVPRGVGLAFGTLGLRARPQLHDADHDDRL